MSTGAWRVHLFPSFEHLRPPSLCFISFYRKTKHTYFHVTLSLEMQSFSLGAWEAQRDGNSCKLPKSSLRGWLQL